jgi:tellurite resistance protein
MDFFPEIPLSNAQAEAIARGLFAVARAEGGVHDKEAAMVKSFYGEAVRGGALHLATLEQSPDITPEILATALSTPEAGLLFLKSAILLGYADGDYGKKEREVVGRYAKALKVENPRLEALEQNVKEFLVGQLSHLRNVDAAVKVARDLKV